jgi:amidase
MTTAPLIGDVQCDPASVIDAADWSRKMNAIDAFMPLFNTTGHPAISLPLHWADNGLPAGIQFVAPFAEEMALLQVGALFEEALPWSERRPPIHVSDRHAN